MELCGTVTLLLVEIGYKNAGLPIADFPSANRQRGTGKLFVSRLQPSTDNHQ